MDIIHGILVVILYFLIADAVIVFCFVVVLSSCGLAKRSTNGMNNMVQDIVERRQHQQSGDNQQQGEGGVEEREPLIPHMDQSPTGREERNETAAGSLV